MRQYRRTEFPRFVADKPQLGQFLGLKDDKNNNTAAKAPGRPPPDPYPPIHNAPEPGSIALDEVFRALQGDNVLIARIKSLAQQNPGTLQECEGCGRILIKDDRLMFGEVLCYCENPAPSGVRNLMSGFILTRIFDISRL